MQGVEYHETFKKIRNIFFAITIFRYDNSFANKKYEPKYNPGYHNKEYFSFLYGIVYF